MTVIQAVAFATQEHLGQTRCNGAVPYIVHPIRVAEHADRAGLDEPAICAAVLHDVLEDCPRSAQNSAFIKVTWPDSWVLVDLLTKKNGQAKELYYAGILSNPTAVSLKLIDRADNLEEMFSMLRRNDRPDTDKGTLRWAQRYIEKTTAEFPPLTAACGNLYALDIYNRAFAQLKNIVESVQ